MANSTRSPVDEHTLAGLETPPVVKRFPGGDQHQRGSSSLRKAQSSGLGSHKTLVHHDQLGVIPRLPAQTPVAEVHLVSHCKVPNSGSHGFHNAGTVTPQNGRHLLWIEGAPLPQFGVDGVDAGCLQTDAQLPLAANLGLRYFSELQNLWPAGHTHDYGFHALKLSASVGLARSKDAG